MNGRMKQIQQIQQRIEQMRTQLKKLSDSASKIIQKKLTRPNGTKSRPKLNPTFQSKKLQEKQDQKQKIFREIAETKEKIQSVKEEQQPQVKAQILKKEIKLKELQKEYEKIAEEKKFVLDQLQKNKSKLTEIKDSTYNKDLLANQKLLQTLKKQKASIEKQIYELNNQEIQCNMYFFQLKQKVQRRAQDQNQDQKSNLVSPEQIKKLIGQINKIIDQRNTIQKAKSLQISSLKWKIQELKNQNKQLDAQYRMQHGQMMKKSLEQRFYQSQIEKISKSVQKLPKSKQYVSVYVKKEDSSVQNNSNLLFAKLKTKRNQNIIQLGSNQVTQSCKLLEDRLAKDTSIDRIVNLAFLLFDEKIVGIKSTYLSKQGKKIQGKLLSIDRTQKTMTKDFNLKDVKQIQYPLNSKNICLKLHKYNGSTQSIGTQYYGATTKSNISPRVIKKVDVIVQKNKQGAFQKIKAVIFHLESLNKSERQKIGETSQQEKQQDLNTFLTGSPLNNKRKAQSIDNLSNYKKKLVLKPIKKEAENQNLDHRLLIRKKLV